MFGQVILSPLPGISHVSGGWGDGEVVFNIRGKCTNHWASRPNIMMESTDRLPYCVDNLSRAGAVEHWYACQRAIHINKSRPHPLFGHRGEYEDSTEYPLLERPSNALICTLHIQYFSVLHETKSVWNNIRGMFEMNCLFLSGDFKFQVSPKVLISCPRSTPHG